MIIVPGDDDIGFIMGACIGFVLISSMIGLAVFFFVSEFILSRFGTSLEEIDEKHPNEQIGGAILLSGFFTGTISSFIILLNYFK